MKKLGRNDIARAWGCRPDRVSKIKARARRQGVAVPEFATQAEARAWLENFSGAGTAAAVSPVALPPPPAVEGLDFDSAQARRAEAALELADGLFRAAVGRGHHGEVARALRNLTDAHAALARVRERHLQNQERAGRLIDLDSAINGATLTLGHVRHELENLGERLALQVNPGDPARARQILDAEIDRIFEVIAGSAERIARELEITAQRAGDAKADPVGDPAQQEEIADGL